MKTLYIDIETTPNLADVWGLFNQTVSLSQLRAASRLLCFGYKWKEDKDVSFLAEWQFSEREEWMARAWYLLDSADVVVTYNGDHFDLKTLNRELLVAGMVKPAPYISVDLYKEIKKNFLFASHKLDHVTKVLELGQKVQHSGHDLWVRVMEGQYGAQREMEEYCKHDVLLTQLLHERLEGWVGGPNLNLFLGTEDACPGCGLAGSLTRRGERVTATATYQRYVCGNCGKWSQSVKRERGVNVKAI